jgi:cysteinyl-tRNA synthetase
MKLHNTRTKQIEQLSPLSGNFRMYSCGPTVYDHVHIGNLSSFIFADTVRRGLTLSGTPVTHAMNFTDVDDKTIGRSTERYPQDDPMEALLKLTNEYTRSFLEDMNAVGNDTDAVTFIKATDSIKAMQQLVQELHGAGFAYLADDGVYFSIDAYRAAGKTYGQLTEISANSTSEARINNDEYDKESAHDFALWKKQKPGEPAWTFQIEGQDLTGRPGWHLECSAMSKSLLGQPFDIHTGGIDLIFPHHENEIAQSTATTDNPLYATHFAHNEHLLVDGKKMSKSLNNFITLQDITGKGFDPLAFRLLVLQAHYAKQAHFSWENLEAAQNRLQAYRALAVLRWQPIAEETNGGLDYDALLQTDILEPLSDNLNTPQVLANMSVTETTSSSLLLSGEQVAGFTNYLATADEALGLGLLDQGDITDSQKQLVAERQLARENKDWARSDELRDALLGQGITVRDTPHGPIWQRA